MRIEALEMDNNALGRRLELVKTELEQVRIEKDKTNERYLECVDEVEAAQRKLNGEDDAEGSDQILCDQIESEKLQARAT